MKEKLLLEFLPDAVIVHNNDIIFFCNKTAALLVGVKDPSELIGSSVWNLVPPHRRKSAAEWFRKIEEGKWDIPFTEGQIIGADGLLIDVEISSVYFHYQNQPAILNVMRDISYRKQIEALKRDVDEKNHRLKEALEYDRIKTEFLTNISHEFRTPLNVIFSVIQLLDLYRDDRSWGNSRQMIGKHVEIMKQNCYRLVRLTNNLIDITRIDSGLLKINPVNCNIVDIIKAITFSVKEYIENRDISLQLKTDVEEIIIACDPDAIERMILNLLSNAIKFTKPGGCIEINMIHNDTAVIISIHDTGIGIHPDHQSAIFERFRQVDKSLTREQEGSGIGLSLVKALIEMHDGSITVESELGKGSLFSIMLPIRLLPIEKPEQHDHRGFIQQNLPEKINIEFSDIYSI